MDLTNEFRVAVPVGEAWALLTDVERIAPCMPGAELQEIEGDEYRGVVKVKVGPITAQYKGKATFVERDEPGHRAVLRAEGRDTRGQGNANATITATLTDDAGGTRVTVVTELTVTGRVAQFGRGVLADVSGKLVGQFVDCLEANVLAEKVPAEQVPAEKVPAEKVPAEAVRSASGSGGNGHGRARATSTYEPVADADTTVTAPPAEPSSGPRRIESAPAEPVDLLATAGAPVARRAVPIVLGGLFLLLLLRRRRRRRSNGTPARG
jgi:hypothetical protein